MVLRLWIDRLHSCGVLVALLSFCGAAWAGDRVSDPIAPWSGNPWYWSYHGEPVLLLGGSDDDNLFQWPQDQLLPQLDRLQQAGGNVIRNTMSDRPDRGFEVYPYLKLDASTSQPGKFDLDQWNPTYWERLASMLRETARREIFVQIEVWDRFDFTDVRQPNWQRSPYRPANNVNYSAKDSGFADRYPDHPGANKQPFFFTTPKQRNNALILKYQQRFVDKLLEHSLKYDHVLYCIDNETRAEPAWGEYWARFIKQRASRSGKPVCVTEMWDAWNLRDSQHRHTFDRPELYDFVDVSQNNHNSGQQHWDNFLFVRGYLAQTPRPMNTTKTYGATGNKFKHTDQDGIERFWRHLLAGAASMRFHRPDSGLGLNDQAVASIRAARLLESEIPIWTIQPRNDLLENRGENQAYLAAGNGRYAVFFPKPPTGNRPPTVQLKLPAAEGYQIKWINIDTGQWGPAASTAGGKQSLTPPSPGNWAATIKKGG